MSHSRHRLAVGAVLLAAAGIALLFLVLRHQGPPVIEAQQVGEVEMSLGVKAGAFSCQGDPEKPDKCDIESGSPFTLSVNINAIPAGGYSFYQVQVSHSGLISKAVENVAPNFPFVLPPDGVGTESFITAAFTSAGQPLPLPKSNHLGPLVEADLNCTTETGSFKISIVVPQTAVLDPNLEAIEITTTEQGPTKVADTLLINCGELPTPTPTDTPTPSDKDGDGCTNEQELQPKSLASAGGGRDPNYFWDFFDTWATGTRTGNIDGFDIGDVVVRFGTVHIPPLTKEEALAEALTPPVDATSYHAASDRDSPDPEANLWNLGPPSGNIDGFDIGFIVVQFGHSCLALP